jgi:hypothetical protein
MDFAALRFAIFGTLKLLKVIVPRLEISVFGPLSADPESSQRRRNEFVMDF